MTQPEIHVLRVFPDGPGGGNPAPIVPDAAQLGDAEMMAIAARYGHESGFVLPPENKDTADFRFRYFVPKHEMEMCGHATIGALWLLRGLGHIGAGTFRIETLSGSVEATVPEDGAISITQPAGVVESLNEDDTACVLDVLGLRTGDLSSPKIVNATTSRAKTLVPVSTSALLHALQPDFSRVQALCESIGSTGLYPFARRDIAGHYSARQFPRSSGYPEDAATGIAATALAYGLNVEGHVSSGDTVTVFQGEAMGRPSRITVVLREDGCVLMGGCSMDHGAAPLESESRT